MTYTVMGSGTSQGVPVIGCSCEVCRSDDPHDNRLRSALQVSSKDTHIVVDIGPDFREQLLRYPLPHIDALFLTHEHNDHIAGLDDIRPYYFIKREPIDIYCLPRVAEAIRERFPYVFQENPYPGVPELKIHLIEAGDVIRIGDIEVECLDILHGKLPILGFRIADFAYITDAKTIPTKTMTRLQDLDTLIINALHHSPHHSHLNLEESLEIVAQLRPEKALLTHLSHQMGLAKDVSRNLPPKVALCFDGLQGTINC